MQLGQTPKLNLMVPKTSAEAVAGVRVWSANDIFVESSGAIHALAALGDHHSLDGRVGYFYLPTSDLPSTIAAHSYLPGAFRPRFTNNRDDLSLVVPRTSGKTFLDIYRRSNNTHAGQALDLSSETTSRFSVMYDSNFGYSDTVFVEHPRYQSRDAVGLEIGVLGSWERGTDNTVWNFSFK